MDTSSIIFDGGSLAGWMIPSWHRPSPVKDGQDRRQDTQEKELSPDPAPSTVAVATPDFPVTHPVGQRFSYIRVSSADQNLARQREMIGPVDKEFLDKLSARSRAERPGLERCLDYLRDHDELTGSPGPWSTYARSSTRSPPKELPCTSSKTNLTFSAESTDPRVTLILGILGSFAEFERAIIRERQAEGIAPGEEGRQVQGPQTRLDP